MGADVEVLKGDWRRAIRPAEVEARLLGGQGAQDQGDPRRAGRYRLGAYNDIEAIGKVIKACGHPALFMVDTVASLGCMPFDMEHGASTSQCPARRRA
jgi:Serine-pyruvate aminotransferase/archaeal aspartate aminotransferase